MSFRENAECESLLKTKNLGNISYIGVFGKKTRFFCKNMKFNKSYMYDFDQKIEVVEFVGKYEEEGDERKLHFLKIQNNFFFKQRYNQANCHDYENLMDEKLSWFFEKFHSQKTNFIAFRIGDFFYLRLPANKDTREFLKYFYITSPAHQLINKYCFLIPKLNNLIKNTKFMEWLNLQIKGTREDIDSLKKYLGFLFFWRTQS